MLYPLVRPLFFKLDPERVHELVMGGLSRASKHPALLKALARQHQVSDPRLKVSRFGLDFPNPVGLAAGMDKDAAAVPAWAALGFGTVELGTVTSLAQEGNPKPRLFRLPQDGAIINRMGFNNLGADAVAARLATLAPTSMPLGLNLGKSKVTPLAEAAGDYLRSLEVLWPHAHYFVINVSSPNTPGLRDLQAKEALDGLLGALTAFAQAQKTKRPLLLKIAPDLSDVALDDVLELTLKHELDGLVATNTTLSRDGLTTPIEEAGGLSGKPLAARALEVLRYLRAQLGAKLPLVSAGGIFTAEDAYARIKAGASLVQAYTGLVYMGPGIARDINKGLLRLLARDGIATLEAAVGLDA